MKITRKTFLKNIPLVLAGCFIPSLALQEDIGANNEKVVVYKNFQEVHWFDDRGKTVFVEKVPLPDNGKVYSLRVSCHIRERVS